MKGWVLWGILLFVVLLPVEGSPQPATRLADQINPLVQQVMAREDIKGMTMALVMPGQEPVVIGFGFSDLENQLSVQPTTLFPVASLTKTLTNIAILQLYEQGLINLRDPVEAYLPEFAIHNRYERSAPITIHHLQCHTSGLPRDIFKGLFSSSPQPKVDLLEYLSEQYVSFPPGTKYSYSNLGYELLGMIIEKVSGMPYQEYITQKVLTPMGMNHSQFLSASLNAEHISRPYVLHDQEAKVEPPLRLIASAGLYSCAADFGQLLEFLLRGDSSQQMVGDSLVAQMFANQKNHEVLDVSLNWGFSWLLEEHPDPFEGYFAYQIGNTLHYNSLMAVAPDYEVGVVLFSNTAGTIQPILDLARQIITLSLEQLTGLKASSAQPVEQPPVIAPDPEVVNLTRGDYLSENLLFQIFAIHNDVVLKVGNEAFRLFGNEDGWFWLNPELRFKVRRQGQAKVLLIDNNGFISPEAMEVDAHISMPQDIDSRLGTYYLANVDPHQEEVFYQKLELRKDENNILQVTLYLGDFHMQLYGIDYNTYNLIPSAEGNMIFAGFGMYRGETLFLDKDKEGYIVVFSGLEFFKPFASTDSF